MIYVSIISIMLWPLIANFLSNLLNIKNKILTSFLSIFVLLQTVWFFVMMNPNSVNIYAITKILFITCISVYFIALIFFFGWQYKKNIIVIDFIKIKASLLVSIKDFIPYAISFSIAIIFILFTWMVDHDTWYYIKISNNFKQSLFTADGVYQLSNNIYKFPALYYATAVFFPEDIQMGFFVLVPLINVFIGVSIVDQCVNKFKTLDYKMKLIISTLLSIAIMFIILSTINYSSGGNTVLQGLLFAAIISNIFTSKNFEIENSNIIICLSMMYFSSTGLMLSLPIIIAIFIFRVFRIGINKTLELLPLILVLIIASLITFIPMSDQNNIFAVNNSLNIAYYVIFCLSFVAVIILSYFHKKISTKNMSILPLIKMNWIWCSICAVLFMSTIIGSIIVWGFGFKENRENYLSNMFILYMLIYLVICLLFLYQAYKFKTINFLILFIFILNLISIAEVLTCEAAKITSLTSSLWRLNFLLIGFGNVPDICINLSIILSMLFGHLYNWYRNKKLFNSRQVLIHSKKIYLTSAMSLAAIANFICFGSYFKIFSDSFLMKFNSDVVINTQNVSNYDRNILNTLKFTNFSEGYFTDMQVSFMIDNGVDLTYRLGKSVSYDKTIDYPSESYTWNFYNLSHSINQWNKNNTNDRIINNPVGISNQLNITIDDLLMNPTKSINNNSIINIKYFIFSKNSTYFSAIGDFFYSNKYTSIDGENIKVFMR